MAPQHGVQVAHGVGDGTIEAGAVDDGIGAVGSGEAQELHVRAGNEVQRPVAEHQHAEHGGDRVRHPGDHLGGGEALFQRPVVAGEHLGVERARQMEILEPWQVEIGERGPVHRLRVERRVPVAAFLVEDAFVLRAGHRPARTDPYPDASLEPHRRGVGRGHGHDGHVGAAQRMLADRHRRQRQDVAVRLAVGELQEQGVIDLKARGRSVVPHADEDHPGSPPVRQIVGEGADGLAHRTRNVAVEGRLALDEIRFDVGHQRFELDVRIGHVHTRSRRLAHHAMVAHRPVGPIPPTAASNGCTCRIGCSVRSGSRGFKWIAAIE